MPVITMTLGQNQADINQKKEFIETVTKSAVDILKLPEQAFTILIQELEPTNIGVGGITLCDKYDKK